jgi:hypothetical protein
MSSSSRRAGQFRLSVTHLVSGLVVVGVAGSVHAAQYYVQPVATVAAETNSNIDLDPGGGPRVEGYGADAAALISIATPDSETTVRPRIRYEDYPKDTGLNRLEAMFDFNSRYRSPRNDFSLSGRFDHLNDTEAQSVGAQFNDVVRNYLLLQPRYVHRVSQLMAFGVSGLYQTQFFSPANVLGHVDFDYYQGNAFVSRKFGKRAELSVGGFASRYEAKNILSTADAIGANVGLEYDLAETLTADVNATYQRTKVDSLVAPVFTGTTRNWGASGGLVWRRQAEVFRINLGRTVSPGSGGGTYSNDQLQAEYDREVSERLSYSAAVRLIGSRGLWANLGSSDRNYARGDLSAKWMLSRTWIVQGGYSYSWQKYHTDPASPNNSQIYVRFGYQGLPRPQ